MQEANGAKKSSLFISSSVHIHTLHIDACIATYLKVRESVENYGGKKIGVKSGWEKYLRLQRKYPLIIVANICRIILCTR